MYHKTVEGSSSTDSCGKNTFRRVESRHSLTRHGGILREDLSSASSPMTFIDVLIAIWHILEIIVFIGDIVAGLKSRPNRQARREAKAAGKPIPPRDVWAILFLVFSFLLVAIGSALLIYWLT